MSEKPKEEAHAETSAEPSTDEEQSDGSGGTRFVDQDMYNRIRLKYSITPLTPPIPSSSSRAGVKQWFLFHGNVTTLFVGK